MISRWCWRASFRLRERPEGRTLIEIAGLTCSDQGALCAHARLDAGTRSVAAENAQDAPLDGQLRERHVDRVHFHIGRLETD